MRIPLCAAIAVVTIASRSFAGDLDAIVRRHGVTVSVPHPDKVADALVALVESSSVNSSAYVRPARRWKTALRASSLVRVRFNQLRVMQLMSSDNKGWRPAGVQEIVLVVPKEGWPDHVLLKSSDRLVSVTKYSPCALAHVVTEAGLRLSDVPRYKKLLEACASGN